VTTRIAAEKGHSLGRDARHVHPITPEDDAVFRSGAPVKLAWRSILSSMNQSIDPEPDEF
jgi:hypothetical protein